MFEVTGKEMLFDKRIEELGDGGDDEGNVVDIDEGSVDNRVEEL